MQGPRLFLGIMDPAFKLQKENPRNRANIIAKLFFAWIVRFFYKGTKTVLTIEDLYKTLTCDNSKYLGDKLEEKWCVEKSKWKTCKKYKPSLLKAIVAVFFGQYVVHGILIFVAQIALRSPQPIVLSWLLREFQEGTEQDISIMYALAGILILISTLVIFFFHHNNFGQNCVGMRIRIAVSSLIYRKIMKINKRAQDETAAGQVINLLSNDVQRFDQVCMYLHYLWIMPFQLALVTYFLWNAVGVSCLAGILSMILFTLPVQGYLGTLTSVLRLKVAERTDARVKLMSETISGIKVIKMYAWEKPFEKLITLFRMREIRVLTKTSYLRGFYLSCMVFIERATLFLTLICYILLGNRIKADIVFSMAQFFNILQVALALYYPMAISLGAETLVSIRRLEKFLNLEEIDKSPLKNITEPDVVIKEVSACWGPGNLALSNINLNVPKGSLCAVIGPVGAGKSALLQLLLRELPTTSGTVVLGQNISYSSQEPWLFAASVKQNILFGKPYDSYLYNEVAHVCALERDFKQFPFGDKTLVGDKGLSLSGGQRTRINLARAIYRQADVYLLDDPLSAVDSHVGKHLFEQCIVKYLAGKTRILVTHQLQYLKKSDFIVVLNEGRIEAKGNFEELSKSQLKFTNFLVAENEINIEQDSNKQELVDVLDNEKIVSILNNNDSESPQNQCDNRESSELEDGFPFWEYMKSVNNLCLVVTVIFVLIISQTACTCTDLWVALWTGQEEMRQLNSTEIIQEPPEMEHVEVYHMPDSSGVLKKGAHYSSNFYTVSQNASQTNELDFNKIINYIFDTVKIDNCTHKFVKKNVAIYIYSCLIILSIILTIGRSVLFFKSAMRASKNIHRKVVHCLIKTSMRFFDSNSNGRVLNRFSKDMGAIDEILPRVLIESIQITLVMSGILVTVIISNLYMILATILLGGVFLTMRSWYIKSAKQIKHLEGIAKSPVFSHINSSISGLTTIRAAQAENILIKEFDEHQNVHTSAWFLTIMCTASFGLWLDLISLIFVTCVTFGFVIATDYGVYEDGSIVGLAISQSLILTGMLQYGMTQTAEVINQLTSVERVLQYTKLKSEESLEPSKESLPEFDWPSLGKIEFRNLSLNYVAEQAPVLKNLNFVISPGEKVGIVGRTGAGKSSLISALFRLAPIEGQIYLDDIDTKTVGLINLRKKISIIPQEPVLFSATLRYNLDPFSEFQDNELWSVLEQVELKDLVTSLDFQVSEGGNNFSLGQKQLLCLARALLRNNKVLLLDEATANVDARTDGLIQATIKKKFKDCTVLTIAHRLNTIMDSDKVLVMGSGQVLEFDHPYKLLCTDGYLKKLVMETGPSMTERLGHVAFNAWKDCEGNVDPKEETLQITKL